MDIFNTLLGLHILLALISLIALKEKVRSQGRSNLKAWLNNERDTSDIDDLVLFRCYIPSKEVMMILCSIPLVLGATTLSILVIKNDIWMLYQNWYLDDTLEIYIKFITITILRLIPVQKKTH
jgi:hypothetical protein